MRPLLETHAAEAQKVLVGAGLMEFFQQAHIATGSIAGALLP